jgi:outer membrane protein OmpA-like peptidoglycan-associated protein
MAMPEAAALRPTADRKSIRAKALPGGTPRASTGLDATLGRSGAGRLLPAGERAFFEPRFGRDLGQVRLHDDSPSAAAARSISAQAFTLGRDIYLGSGAARPGTPAGRHLLAHELTHVLQQDGERRRVQRRLVVSTQSPDDPNDPANSFANDPGFGQDFRTEVDELIQELCGGFRVDQSSGAVVEDSTQPAGCGDPDSVAEGAKPGGCCCLCVLTAPGTSEWTIRVTQFGPRTLEGDRDIFIHSRSSDPQGQQSVIQFSAFDVSNQLGAQMPPALVLGHEACGHAALLELRAHPPFDNRAQTDVHDPTVKVQNLIAGELGVAPGDLRGSARSGSHRGESVSRITVARFPFNGLWVAGLPRDERKKVDLASDFIRENNAWVDIIGHSDATGTPAAKQRASDLRAQNMKASLRNRGISQNIRKELFGRLGDPPLVVSGNRFTLVEGRSDNEVIATAPDEQQRRVEIFMPTFPAGAQNPPPGTPTTVDPVGPEFPGTTIFRGLFGNACERLLIRTAWL